MKETVASMRAYLILTGLVSGALTVFALTGSQHLLVSIFSAIGLLVAFAYIAVGVALRPMLRLGVLPITVFVGACLAWIAFSFLVGLLLGQIQLLTLVVGTAINLYLLRNGRRLAREMETSPSAVSRAATDGPDAG